MKSILVLTSDGWKAALERIVQEAGANCLVVLEREQLTNEASKGKYDYLVSFATGVIVPDDTLKRFPGRAFNVHPAPPEYPGNFPHHFAVYEQATSYGATAHFMTKEVDSGPIVDVEYMQIEGDIAPRDLMIEAESKGRAVFERLVGKLAQDIEIEPLKLQWGPSKTSRRDFQNLCRISVLDSAETAERKLKAVTVEGYDNAHIVLHGEKYVHQCPLEDSVVRTSSRSWAQFTETGYRELLALGKEAYKFAHFTDKCEEKHLIWRHDLDHSIERACRTAQIENEMGVEATYMFVISLPYYNVFDIEVRAAARDIAAMGHRIGLHFNASAYKQVDWTLAQLENAMSEERNLLSKQFETPVDCVSFHDPTRGNLTDFGNSMLAGMVNAYSKEIRETYGYCSDSNGYWRHEPIPDVLKQAKHGKLQVLTHPEWWTEVALPPRARIENAIMKQSRRTMAFYDRHLEESGRRNLRK